MKKARELVKRTARKAALHVIPHPDNGHIPHVVRGHYITGLSVIAILIFAGVVWGIPQSQRWGLTAAVYSSVLVDLTNEAREENDLPALRINPTLEKAALLKAEDMHINNYFAHNSPQGKTPWYWLDQVGYRFMHAGENLAIHFNNTKAVQRALLASPTHRANILNINFTEIGIATYEGTYDGVPTTFVVESFATPAKSLAIVTTETTPNAPPQITTPTPPQSQVLGTSEVITKEPTAVTPKNAPQPITRQLAKTEPTPTPVKVIHEDENLAIAENTAIPTEPVIATTDAKPVAASTWYERFLMNPSGITTTFLVVIGLLVLVGIGAMLTHEIARKHTRHIAYGVGFVVLVLVLIGLGNGYAFPSLTVI